MHSPELEESSEAAGAITALAPPFLEDVLIELTKTNCAYAAIEALRKANTLKTREALAQIARNGSDSMLRLEAIRNLGRTNDVTYLPTLVQLMNSDSKEIQNAAAEAAGNLGGSSAVPQLASLISSPNVVTRLAGTNGLGNSHANEAVPLLIGMLVDADPNIRQAAVSGLWLLTQRAAFDGNGLHSTAISGLMLRVFSPPPLSVNGGCVGGVLTGTTVKPTVWLIARPLSRLTDRFQRAVGSSGVKSWFA